MTTEPARNTGRIMAEQTDLERLKQAQDALKIQNAVTDLARRYDARLVMEAVRGWLVYMDAQIARIDREA